MLKRERRVVGIIGLIVDQCLPISLWEENEGEDKSTKKGIKRASTTTNTIHQIPNLMPVCGDRRELKGGFLAIK